MMVYSSIWILCLAFIVDFLIGDPRWLYHPVQMIGLGISWLEKCLRKLFPASAAGERVGGMVLGLVIPAVSAGIPLVVLYFFGKWSFWLYFGLSVFWSAQILAARSLQKESMKVYTALKKGDIEGARYAVSMIVGRDTKNLDEKGIIKAAVETVAENFSDGVTAPLFYMILGGPAAGFFYKAVNTLDSMVGYRNEKYQNFGRFSAKFDDVLNFIPARISAVLLIVAGGLSGLNMKKGMAIFRRDRFCHKSPNSAQTEAAAAGLLEVQLAGDAWYFGKKYKKDTIGDDIRPVEAEDIRKINEVSYLAAVLAVVSGCLLRALVIWIWK